ncbi:hypothetical protein ACWZHB_11630 [Nocardia sp. FBN12]|uniref:hypothetical protein n=1 Tax=Nocardia sp. FBN12 TaxID=3419766 RepID=UPI003CFE613F
MSVTLTTQEKATLRTAAYGAVSLLAAAGAATCKPHKIATTGSIALSSATGLVGHVLAEKSGRIALSGTSVAELADQVLPALTAAMSLLGKHDPVEAENFRNTIAVAIDTAQLYQTRPNPAMTDLTRKITGALAAA